MKGRNEVVVGIVIVLGIVLVIFGTVWMKGLKLGAEERTIQAHFNEVGLLRDGGKVKFRGVPIGRVESVELESAGQGVIVTMTIDADVKLPAEPVVILAPESMFGDWMAEISPRASHPLYRYAEPHTANVLPGYTLPDISQLTAVADEIAQNLRTISARFEIAFTEETAKNVSEAIENIQLVSEQLTGLVGSQSKAIDEVARNLAATSESAGEAAETMNRAFAEVEGAVGKGKLTSIVENVQRTSARTDSLTSLLVASAKDLQRVANSADTTFRAIGDIAGRVQRGEGSMGKLLRDTTLYTGLSESSMQLQALLKDLRENPRKYINLRVF
jgi:phospholipid/cholesterol/gamma-HCH transport system substrate-binding protein